MDLSCGLVDNFRGLVLNLTCEQRKNRNTELNEQLDELDLKRSFLQHRVDKAKNNGEQIEEKVLDWLCKVEVILEQGRMFHEEESQAKSKCNITSCPNTRLRYKLSERAKMIIEDAKIYGNRNFDRISFSVPLLSMVELTSNEGNEGIDSRVPIMNQILEELRNPGVNMIGLCGFGGVGKTTIAKDVAKNQKIFEKVIMATVSQELNIEKIQGQIAEKLNMQLSENNKEVRAFRVCERLKQEKNMLLILDDIWEELDFGKVGIPLFSVENYSKKNEGCKILLTSRNKALLSNVMKCQKIVEVGVLSEDEALELFKRIAGLSTDSSSPELISIATNIVRKCGGLPLAIATTAKALRNKDINDWNDALTRLNNPFKRNNTSTREVDDILKWSYDRLSSSEYKHIFLLAAMVSHDPSIEDLLMYSVGLDILDGIENMEDARVRVSTIVSKLKSLNLFVDSISSHHVTMHEVFRDVALPIASNELHSFIRTTLKEWPDENMLQGCQRICLQESDISDLPEELYCSSLQFFLLNSTKRDLNIPNMFFKSSKELKVLAFTNVHFSSLLSLIFLHKLKALCLHSCLLEDIADVRSLKNLKVLSFAYSEIQRLPIELAELTSLQMLNLSHCSNLKVIPQKLLSSLKKLEILYLGNSFNQWKVEGYSEANENASLNELIDLPLSSLDIHIPIIPMLPENLFLDMNMKRYKISIGNLWEWQDNYETSKILKLQLQSRIHLKGGVSKLLEGVEELYLNGCNALENVLHSPEGRGFLHIRHLQLDGNYDIRSDVFHSADHEGATKDVSNKTFKSLFNQKVLLPKLEILELSNILNRLIPLIWDDQVSYNSFNNLKVLVVKSCNFVKLVSLHVLKSLNNLEEVEVASCDMLEIVFDLEDLNDYYKEVESSSAVLPLKMLKLRNLPKLKDVWKNICRGNNSFPSLRSVKVSYCESLSSIFPALPTAKGMLSDLEELQISNCNIEVIVAKDQVSKSVADVLQFPRLTSLELHHLPQLTNFYPERHALEWPHLQQLSIKYCDVLEIFGKEVSSEIYEEESTINSKYPLFSHDKIIHNLEELNLEGKPAEMVGRGQFSMYHFPKVKRLRLCVDNATIILYKTLLKSFPNLEEVQLSGHFAEAFGGDDATALSSPFAKLTLYDIRIKGSLSPLLVSSPNLTYIEVTYCDNLITLMTSSTARSLVHLTHLSIDNCRHIKEIIMKQEGENDEDKEIIFSKLRTLVLDRLYELKRFCGCNYTFRFPLLDLLVIKSCPSFKVFSLGFIDTPSLESIQFSQDGEEHHEVWDADLNKTFYQQRFMVSREVESDEDDASVIRNDQFPTDSYPQVEILVHNRYVTSRELVLDEDDANMIRNDQFPAECCPQVKILRIEGFVEEWVTFPYTLLERFPKLNELYVKNSSFREIFPSHCHIVDQVPPFEKLSLFNLDKLKNIFSSDAPCSSSFHNLTVLKVSQCHQLVYLMTNSIAQSLVNLETLDIYGCASLEEIIRKEPNEDVEEGITLFSGLRILKLGRLPRLKTQEDKNDFNVKDKTTNTGCTNIPISLFSNNKVLLPKLETLELSYLLNNLISLIWDDQLLHNSFNNLKTLILGGCDFMKSVPLRVLKCLNNLEKLEVRYCDKLEMVLAFEDLNDYHKEIESSSVFVPLSLTHLEVNGCSGLTTLMMSSAALSLVHITHISISSCYQIEEIITKQQEGDDDEDREIIFNHLTFLKLVYLPRLKRFCGHNYTFRFPLLEHITIIGCPRLTMFCPGAIHAPRLQSVRVHTYEACKDIWMTNLNNTIQHLFTFKEVISTTHSMAINAKNITNIVDVFPKVSSLYVESFTDEGVTFPYSSLERFPLLDVLHVEHCSFEEIFPSLDKIVDFMGKISPLQELYIAYMDKLKSIWKDDSQLPPTHQNLRFLEVKSCCSLAKLAPSSASFQNLRGLDVSGCHQLIHLVTTSTAKSLVSLRWLEINDCKRMEEIVMNDTNEHVQAGITFNELYRIKVTDMPNLKMFSPLSHTFEFPKLEEMEISGCPEMNMFCPGLLKTPKLSKVKIEEHGMEWKDGEDLNKTMEGLCSTKIISTTHSMAINAKNITRIVDVFPKVSNLYVESFMDEGVTFPYSSLERFPMLDVLHIEHCSFEEIFPSHDQIIDVMGKILQLKELYIAYMDKLESIWKDDSQLPPIHQNLIFLEVKSCCSLVQLAPSSASFQNLGELHVSGCHQLIHLVTTSTAKSLVSLRWLEINDCKRMEEIVMNDTNEDVQAGITFNELYRIKVTDMPSLKMFSPQSHTFEFPKLEEMEISGCPEMNMFCPGLLKTPKLSKVKIEEHGMEWKDGEDLNKTMEGLCSTKVLPPGLEILELSNLLNRLTSLIWDDQLSHNSFNNLKVLVVKSCGFVNLVPFHVLKSLNNLEEMEVKSCYMLEIVFDFEDFNDNYKEMESSSVVVPLKKLKLLDLPKLKNVWGDHYQGVVSFPSLRSVDVSYCESLTSIFPALPIAKGMLCDLEELQISNCSMHVIVAKDQVSEYVAVTFRFPRLTSLLLFDLPNLRNFYPQKHTLEWPHLNKLSIQCCDELEIFKKQGSSSSEIYEEENMLDSKYPLLSHDKVIGNLERLTLQGREVENIGSGQFLMYHFPKLKQLHLSLEKEPSFTFWERSPSLGELKLSGDIEKVLGGDNVAALVACFSKLTLAKISIMGSLSPCLVSSPNLTHLNVNSCCKWITLMTSSIARSLVHLTHLSIRHCDQIEEIIIKQEGEDDEDKEIFFIKMKFLTLNHLSRLKRFCGYNYTFIFPLLEHVTITECPRLTMFCPGVIHAPQLQNVGVHTDEAQKDIWMTDFNNTIQHLFSFEEVISTTHSMAINAKNITKIVDVFPKVSSLYVESFTDEGVTFPYSSLERFPMLDVLHVDHCSFEEVFPSQDHIIDFMGKISPLKKLYIAYMDKLKSIWKDDSQLPPIHQNLNFLQVESCCSLVQLAPSSASFQNLGELHVSGCYQLIHLVTTLTAKSLVSLRWLEINDCKRMEEIVMNDTNEDVQDGITFNRLYSIELSDMPSLKMFSAQNHTFEFPELKEIEIYGCPEMKKFCPGVWKTPKLSKVKIEEHDMEYKDEKYLIKTM